MTNLSDTNAHRRIAAAEVRAQAITIPTTTRARRHGYPHAFHNREALPLANTPPLIEHPLTPYVPYVAGSPPGPARIVTNRDDRSTPEAIYHDPSSPLRRAGRREFPFSKAPYRGRKTGAATGLEDGFAGMEF